MNHHITYTEQLKTKGEVTIDFCLYILSDDEESIFRYAPDPDDGGLYFDCCFSMEEFERKFDLNE